MVWIINCQIVLIVHQLFAAKVDYLDLYPLESVLDVDFFQPLSSEYLIFITKTIVLIKTKDSYLTFITKQYTLVYVYEIVLDFPN